MGVSLSNTEVNGHTPNVEGTIPINDYEELDDVSTFSIGKPISNDYNVLATS